MDFRVDNMRSSGKPTKKLFRGGTQDSKDRESDVYFEM